MNYQVLVLNKNFSPIAITNAKRAFLLLYSNKAKVLEIESYYMYEWEEWGKIKSDKYKKIKTPQKEICVPEILVLISYDKIKKRRIIANKKNIYKRDMGHCQYCGIFLSAKDSTIDHINPKSKNGKFTWENCVLSCVKCNLKKGSYELHEIGMKLIKNPEIPNYDNLNLCFIDAPKSWAIFSKK